MAAAANPLVLAGIVWDQEGAKIPEDSAQLQKGSKITQTINEYVPYILQTFHLKRAPFQMEIVVFRAEEILGSSRIHRSYEITVIQGDKEHDASRKLHSMVDALFGGVDTLREVPAEEKAKPLPERLKGKDAFLFLFFDKKVFCKDTGNTEKASVHSTFMRQFVKRRDQQKRQTGALAQDSQNLPRNVIAGLPPVARVGEEEKEPAEDNPPVLLSQVGAVRERRAMAI